VKIIEIEHIYDLTEVKRICWCICNGTTD